MNEAKLLQEFTKRAKACLLEVDCLSSGSTDSEIAIICEAPGEHEAKMKMPMVGGAGTLLWDTLRPFDLTRKDFYVTNVVKRQVSLSSKTDARSPVKKTEIEHWEGLLDWELDQLPKLKYILCLGNFALHALTGDTGITKWRGSVFDCKVGRKARVVRVIVSNNPAHILRNLSMEPMYKFDIAKLRRVLDGLFRRHDIDGTINPSFDDALGWIESLERDKKPIAFDIEVIGNETACIGFANNAHTGVCINFRDSTTNRYSLSEEEQIRDRIQGLFHNEENKFIAQNGSFDCGWLWFKDRIHVLPLYFDTLLAHHTLYPRMPHNLGYLTAQYTDHPYYKDEGKTWREGGDINQFWHYNIKDCCITWACHEDILKELKAQDLEEFYFNHVQRLQSHLIQMQVGGILADISLKDSIADSLKEELDAKLTTFHSQVQSLTGDKEYAPNPLSSKQLSELFFSYLGLVGRGSSTNKENRQRMLDHPKTTPEQKELLITLNEYKTEHKFFSTYATQRPDEDNRIRCEYKQFGVQEAPGRLSSSMTMWGSGMNLQNQPHRAYPMFIADDGYMFSYFDLKQAEAKVVAYLWNVQGLIDNFERAENEEGFDVHRGNAARIFKCNYDEIPEIDYDDDFKPTKRFLGKKCVHGLNYRMQAPRLAEECGIPIQQGFEAYAAYHRAFPEIQNGWAKTIQEVKDTKMLFSPLGRRLIWLERLTEESYDSVIAFKPQSTIGDKVSSVIYLCHEDEDWPTDARISLNIHDALIAIHRPKDKKIVQAIMKKHAEAPIPIRGQQIVIFTDFKESVPDEKGKHRWSTLRDLNT
jgi:uracil-DNA glycosylase family 4|tara:strand:+ start:5756 stop:8194 length:2439 start_codon:yes stop_codon:yes gene_type:complete